MLVRVLHVCEDVDSSSPAIGRIDKNDDRHSRDRRGRDSRDGDGSGVENDLESVTI